MYIAIDVGHAAGTGARGNGQEEHALCSVMAARLAGLLQGLGHRVAVIDFPALGNAEDLAATVRAVNAGGYDLSVSLHCDAAASAEAHGAHVCYVSAAGQRAAEAIAGRLCPLLPGRACPTVRRGDLYVLRHTRPVAVLVECGFVTNAHDVRLLRDEPEVIARAIACGVDDYAGGFSA